MAISPTIKALEDMSFSQDPAINIKLKESAKSRLVGTLKAGGGMEQKKGEKVCNENVAVHSEGEMEK